MTETVLTAQQRQDILDRSEDTASWRDEEDLERRRKIGKQLKDLVKSCGVMSGGTVDAKTLCDLISLQWQIQNLNAIQMPKFLGLYAYKVHFGGFQGTEADLHALRKEETGSEAYYPGADLSTVSDALRLMASSSNEDHVKGASQLFDLPGVGQAISSGFLHLLHPDIYGLVNSPTKAPFMKGEWLQVDEHQRKKATQVAQHRFPNVAGVPNQIYHFVFRWQVFLSEVKEVCGFSDFHEVDQFLWTLSAETVTQLEQKLKAIIEEIVESDVKVRTQAESEARALIQDNLGHLSSDQLSSIFTHINTCVGKKGIVYTRCAPAFVGHNANQLIENLAKLNPWIERLWTTSEDDLASTLNEFWAEKIPCTGRSFPSAILYLRDGDKYSIWTENLDKALCSLSGGVPAKIPSGFSYLQYCKRVQQLRKKVSFPFEMHDWVLFRLITEPTPTQPPLEGKFKGFPLDSFQFMHDLSANNNEEWFNANRERFKTSVDGPLRALVKDIGEQVITPLDPKLETSPKTTKCISRIRKNLYGKQTENIYHELFWAAFYRKDRTKNTDCQLYLTIRPNWFSYGVFLGEMADDVREQLVKAMEQYPDLAKAVFSQLKEAGFLFAPEEDYDTPEPIEIADCNAFLDLVTNHHFDVFRRLSPQEAVAAGQQIKQQIGEDFRSLYPLFVMATSSDPQREVKKLLPDYEGGDGETEVITLSDLAADTFMEEAFFQELDQYLLDKRQIVFCGPPGTGKTFVALKYAEYLTQNGGETRTVQFHPSYGYEDFIEGIRPVVGQGGLAYQVEDGIFKRLCDDARVNPKGRYVLLVDEINRGNIPRIFGELLLLLERRELKADLPYSKQPFSIPQNVIILGTMNSSDRSIALMDLALRRRFHFIEMQPRSEVLLGWLKANSKPTTVRDIFEKLNETLRKCGVEDDRLVGHAHFMSSQLDTDYLALIWSGTVLPLLKEYFFAEPEKLAEFAFDKFQLLLEEELDDEVSADEVEELADAEATKAEVDDQ